MRNGSSTILYTVYIVNTVYTVYTAYSVETALEKNRYYAFIKCGYNALKCGDGETP